MKAEEEISAQNKVRTVADVISFPNHVQSAKSAFCFYKKGTPQLPKNKPERASLTSSANSAFRGFIKATESEKVCVRESLVQSALPLSQGTSEVVLRNHLLEYFLISKSSILNIAKYLKRPRVLYVEIAH